MKFNRVLLLLLLIPVYFISCKPQQKMPFYLENVNDTTGKGVVNKPELRIQKGDLLSIQIYSMATRPEVDQVYNLGSNGTGGSVGGTSQIATSGFLVDDNGNIEHFRKELGVFHVEGMTKQELAAEIKNRLTNPVELLKNPTVVIRLTNFRVTVLGEVEQQGQLAVPGERITILEAVGMAGGITSYGKKNSVKILREVNGQRETGIIDLSKKDFFDSPYYHLMQNDVVVVEPTRQKSKEEDEARAFRKVSIGLSLVAAAATLTTIFTRN